ncbi:MAG: hypothetical protein JNK15_03875 [Planctomycetes bacterium]|nr:hypothetical protein [Planctomycetota bacterium]
MRTLLSLLITFLVPLPAQADGAPRGPVARLHDLLHSCHTALAGSADDAPDQGEATLWRLVGHLRAGDPAAAERSLPTRAPWAVVGAAALAQTLGRPPLAATILQDFAAELERSPEPDDRSFATAARCVQAHLSLAELAEASARLGHEPPGQLPSPDDQRALASGALAELEREAWQPGLGWYRARRCAGELLLPDEADPATLLPFALSAFWSHDARLRQHEERVLARTLAQPGGRGTQGLDTAARQLATAVILGDDAARERAFSRLQAALPMSSNEAVPAATAGLVLDALVYAVTGASVWPRPAANAWIELRPWLPPGERSVQLPVLVDGARFTLQLRATPQHTAFKLARTDAGTEPRLVVVRGATWPTIRLMHAGEDCRGSLPRAQADAHDDLHPSGSLDDRPVGRRR